MGNQEIAQVFTDIADILEIKGENVFKIRAYQRAAQAIRSLSEELRVLRGRGPLTGIPGIGQSIAAKIEELLDTGRCQFHQQLLSEFPPGLVSLLKIPDVGPKTAFLIYQTLGIDSVEALEAAAVEHRLRELKRLGPKTEENILAGIERMRRRGERWPLAVAHPHALEVVRQLVEAAPVDSIQPAGSLRRMCETIGDLDILVTSSRPEAVMDAFTSLPMVTQVLAKGPTRSSVVSDLGLQMDVRVLDPENFGAALQYFTGSKQHNIHLRELAVKRGLKISEYGVFKGEERLGGRTEEEVYRAMDLPLIPPEMREDAGEIEAAAKGKLPRLIETSDIRGDLQMHTKWSDGRHTVREMAETALERGYQYICITDHSKSRGIARGLHEDALLRQIEEIRQVEAELGGALHIMVGSEVDIKRDGTLDYDDETLARLDLVVASIHSGFKSAAEEMTERIVRAIQNPYVDLLAHPTGRIIGERDPYEIEIEKVLRAAAEQGVALEINSFPDRLDLKDVHARLAVESGVKLMINTDSHSRDHLRLIEYGVATARRGWVEARHVLNTLPFEELRASLRHNRAAAAPEVARASSP